MTFRRFLLLVLVAVLLGSLAAPSAVPLAGVTSAQAKQKRLTKKQKAKIRRQLYRQLKKNPRLIRKRWFVRKASHVSFELPLTVRLTPKVDTTTAAGLQLGDATPNDTLQFDLGTAAVTLPAGVHPGTVMTTIGGNFKLRGQFGKDASGYGTLGALELDQGNVDLTGTPIDLVHDNATCPGTPLLRSGPLSFVAADQLPAGDRRGGFLNWFTGDIYLRVYTQIQSNSLRRQLDGCADPFFWTDRVAATDNPVVPLDLRGSFNVSPTITADGKLRFMKVAIQDAVTPQTALASQLHFCRAITAVPDTDPAPTATCGDELVIDSFVKAVDVTAEVLIGDF